MAIQAVDYALKKGAKYADVRTQSEESIGFMIREGVIEDSGSTTLIGMCVRVIVDGAWGFCSIDNPSQGSMTKEASDRAIRLARTSARGIVSPVKMAPAQPIRTRIIHDQDGESLAEQFSVDSVLEPAKQCDERVRAVGTELDDFSISLAIGRFIESFANSEGSLITQAYKGYLGTACAVASSSGTVQFYPRDFGGLGDPSKFLDQDLQLIAETIATRAVRLASSRSISSTPTMKYVIMDPELTALWVHEVVGHPLEADRVLGGKGDPGNAPWTYTSIGKKVADPSFNVIDDPSIETPAWFKYDCEGVEGRRKQLISEGVVRSCIHNRETAAAFQVEPNGGARSHSYRFPPMPRMSNTYVASGDWEIEEIIADTKEGIYAIGGLTPSVDSQAHTWSCSTKESYIIRKGEVGEILRNVIVSGITPVFLRSIDCIGRDLTVFVTPDCGKGSPIQMIPVGNGGPTIRGEASVAGVV